MSGQKKFSNAAIWTVLGAGASQGAGFFVSLLLARILLKEGFGQFGLLRTFLFALGGFVGGGLGMAATKAVAATRVSKPSEIGELVAFYIKAVLICGGLLGIGVYFFSFEITRYLFNSIQFRSLIAIGTSLLLLHALSCLLQGLLLGFDLSNADAKIRLVEAIGSFVSIPLGCLFGGIQGALLGTIFSTALTCLFRFTVLGLHLKSRGNVRVTRVSRSHLRTLYDLAVPAVIFNVLVVGFDWFLRLRLSRELDGLSELAYFSAAFSVAQLVIFFSIQLSTPLLSIFASEVEENSPEAVHRLAKKYEWMVFGCSLLSALPTILFSKQIMRCFGPGFENAVEPLILLSVGYCIASFSLVGRAVLTSLNKMWLLVGFIVLWGTVLNYANVPFKLTGALGAAFSYLCAYFAFSLCILYFRRHVLLGERPPGTAINNLNEAPVN